MDSFPKPLSSFYQSAYYEFPYHELLEVSVDITEAMAKSIETATKLQSKSNLWYKYRAGRVTASRMKAVCRTNPVSPSQKASVIQKHFLLQVSRLNGAANMSKKPENYITRK